LQMARGRGKCDRPESPSIGALADGGLAMEEPVSPSVAQEANYRPSPIAGREGGGRAA
jgi:hypothetical protein